MTALIFLPEPAHSPRLSIPLRYFPQNYIEAPFDLAEIRVVGIRKNSLVAWRRHPHMYVAWLPALEHVLAVFS